SLSKKYLQQAKGHPEWVKSVRPGLGEHRFVPVVVSPEPHVDAAARPHVSGLHHLRFDELKAFADRASNAIAELRIRYSGKSYGAVVQPFKASVRLGKLDRAHVDGLLETPLKA